MDNAILFRLLENQMVKDYHLKKLLGAGGFGAVYEAVQVVRDQPLPRSLAVKLIPDKDNSQLPELMAAMELDHPHLIRCHAAGDWRCQLVQSDFLFLVMEQATASLQNRLEQQGKFSEPDTRQLIQQVASALVYLHGQNRVHRDLKPGNVLWVNDTWKVSDLGLIRKLDTHSYLRTANPIGTIAFMPPEAFDQGIISPAWDIWSLGILIVVALGGELPYQFNEPTQLLKRVMDCQLRIPALPAEFAAIAQGCLQKNWRDRWTAQQVLEAMQPKVSVAPSIPVAPSNTQDTIAIAVLKAEPSIREFVQDLFQTAQPAQQQGNYQEHLPDGVILDMVSIPAGNFIMGSNESDYIYEKPLHRVQVPAFYLGKYPITQAQYEAVIGQNPSHFQGVNNPVDSISWEDAQKFCQKLRQVTGKAYRLPSEAEWEYACRAGSTGRYCFGDDKKQLGEYAWFGRLFWGSTHPVGQKRPNAFGLYDMHGNVWEWCEDLWQSGYQGAPTDGSAWLARDPQSLIVTRVFRGGAWHDFARDCRSASRKQLRQGSCWKSCGFRVCCSPQ